MLVVGRRGARERIRRALDAAAERSAHVLVVEGPAGSGKTALLDHSERSAAGFTAVRCHGVEGEQDLPFASLLELLHPHLEDVGGLPASQRDALLGALALAPPTMADRLAIGAAVLQLLGQLAERAPTLIIVDDLQWIDTASRDAILFALRRTHSDRLLGLLGVRDDTDIDLRGFEVIVLGSLSPGESVELLRARHEMTERVAVELAERCEGNPLALIETAAMLSRLQLQGSDPLPDQLPAGTATTRLYRDQINGLSKGERFALLAAAVSHEPTQEVVNQACEEYGADRPGWVEAGWTGPDWDRIEQARLVVRSGGRLVFTHPLVRSAAVGLSDPAAVRSAHRALAAAALDPDRRTWHRAAAAADSDEEVAAELEQMAVDALLKGDSSASVRAAVRASELSSNGSIAARRRLLAAQAATLAGLDPGEHVARARAGTPDVRREAIVIEAAAAAWSGDTQTLHRLVDHDVAELEDDDPDAAAIVCAFAAFAAFNELRADVALALADRAWDLAGRRYDIDHPFGLTPGITASLTVQFGRRQTDELLECRTQIEARGAVDLATPVAMGLLTAGLHEDALEFAERMYAVAAHDGRVVAAAWTATACGMASALMGDLTATVRWCTLGLDLGRATGVHFVVAQALGQLAEVAALRGDRSTVAMLIRQVDTPPLCDSPLPTLNTRRFAQVLDELQSGSLDSAVQQLRAFPDAPIVMTEHWPVLYELIEALVRLDRVEEARMLAPSLAALDADPHLDHRGQIERCRGLMAPEVTMDSHFREAIDHLRRGPRRMELARTRLVYGERLIREGRRQEALPHLREALVEFDQQGCVPWADRARAGLFAEGDQSSEAGHAPIDRLTPQEEQVAHAVASGMTNREAAASLFVSAKTIETHLTRIYRKLGVRSRTELANVIGGRSR